MEPEANPLLQKRKSRRPLCRLRKWEKRLINLFVRNSQTRAKLIGEMRQTKGKNQRGIFENGGGQTKRIEILLRVSKVHAKMLFSFKFSSLPHARSIERRGCGERYER